MAISRNCYVPSNDKLSHFLQRRRNFIYIVIFLIDSLIIWYATHNNIHHLPDEKTKYILFWTHLMPIFNSFEDEGLNTFVENGCEFTNCILTVKRKLLDDVRQFDAIVFSAYDSEIRSLPKLRSPSQKYIMASLESPVYFNTKSEVPGAPIYLFNDYFNWTWTYRLKSDISWRYFLIYDLDGKEVGPKLNMKWLDYFKPVSENIKMMLKTKTKAVAWIVSKCVTYSRREDYGRNLKISLAKLNLSLDLYGECGRLKTKCGNNIECVEMLKKDYYFYLAFENSFDEDYVTEKVLWAIHGFTIPVVLGGANYTRFLPPGSYLDARNLSPVKMAAIMHDIIANVTLYHEYFRWTNHYSYKEAHRLETCNLCKALNNEEMVSKTTVYMDLKNWWIYKQRNIAFMYKQITKHPIFTHFPVS